MPLLTIASAMRAHRRRRRRGRRTCSSCSSPWRASARCRCRARYAAPGAESSPASLLRPRGTRCATSSGCGRGGAAAALVVDALLATSRWRGGRARRRPSDRDEMQRVADEAAVQRLSAHAAAVLHRADDREPRAVPRALDDVEEELRRADGAGDGVAALHEVEVRATKGAVVHRHGGEPVPRHVDVRRRHDRRVVDGTKVATMQRGLEQPTPRTTPSGTIRRSEDSIGRISAWAAPEPTCASASRTYQRINNASERPPCLRPMCDRGRSQRPRVTVRYCGDGGRTKPIPMQGPRRSETHLHGSRDRIGTEHRARDVRRTSACHRRRSVSRGRAREARRVGGRAFVE